ncbi:hypothetical protein FK216_12050 [Moraxellaceae bacterium AER2_44_116]|nr:hypothetical protein FK216_12050 [Moraxellaceae bacterium AER2_44_116]
MLNNVPLAIRRSVRAVTLNHPNRMTCTVYRKVVTRVAPTMIGGLPTLGGLGVLEDDDEADFEYQSLGDGAVVMTGTYQGGFRSDDNSLLDNPNISQQEALLEPLTDDGFTPKKHDLVSIVIGDAVLPYEITDITGTVNIPPFTQKYVLQLRDELVYVAS